MKQRTLSKSVAVTGVGLHSGERVQLLLEPLPENSGIIFCRSDLGKEVRVGVDLINDTRLSSTIVTPDGVRIGTIEHIMSAFAALGIDNIKVSLNAPEIPIMDGSSLPFIYLLQDAKIIEQNEPKKFIRILRPVSVEMSDKRVSFEPHDGYKIALTIEFDHPVFNRSNQTYEIDFAEQSYIDEVARARTFGFMQEVELMRAHNLGLGGNLNNAIVIDDTEVLNPEGLRYPDEFVRHKVLDAIGDLYIVGHQIIGAFRGYKSGHAINNALLRQLLSDTNNYEWVSFKENDKNLPNAFCSLQVA